MITEWWRLAACTNTNPDIFFPTKGSGQNYNEARAICGSCPVRGECLADAIAQDVRMGMRGGLTPYERRLTVTLATVRSGADAPHGDAAGTTAGYYRERSAGVKPCAECSAAVAARKREIRRSKSARAATMDKGEYDAHFYG